MPTDIPAAKDVVTHDDIAAAQDRLQDVVHHTPFDTSSTFADWSGASSVGLKLENTQRTGSFKIRGAYNAMTQLDPAQRDRGVVTASAGNHAQGVALAGDLLDIDTTIVVPTITPAAKIDATRGYGARVVVHGDIYEDAYDHALDLATEDDLEFVHPFNDDAVIAGQGTIGLELLDQAPDLDTVLVAIGGGGLISGIATALKHHDPSIRVVGVQPTGAAHAKPSLERDAIHELPGVDTVADGIADTRLLPKTFAVVREHVDDVVAVTDTQIATAVAMLAERAKTIAEPAGATPLAALLANEVDVTDDSVAVIVSGGNVDLSDHAHLSRTGLRNRGRYTDLTLAIHDWPTALGPITDTIEDTGATLADISRAHAKTHEHPNRVPVDLAIEGSGPDHLDEVRSELDGLDGVTVVAERNGEENEKRRGD